MYKMLYAILVWCSRGFVALGITMAVGAVVTHNGVFLALFFLCILARIGTGVIFEVVICDAFTPTEWFRANGIRTEAEFEKIEITTTTYDGSNLGPVTSYSIQAIGRNPVTGKQQILVQSCRKEDIGCFTPGQMLPVYVHPEKPEMAYRIDLDDFTRGGPKD